MTHPLQNRSRLMVGCASAALALALVFAPERATAQGVQASPTVTLGTADVIATASNETTVTVSAPVAVIDWDPNEDAFGNALNFLPAGNRLIFQDLPGQGGFSVLNRILPATNGNIVVMDGQVIARLQNVSGPPTSGGFVAFYSPTGILVGSTASFDVGSLLLTTLDTTPLSFNEFVSGGTMTLNGQGGSTARIQINPGAQITATRENSFFAVVAADVQMLGTARVNGSHAYVAGELVNLSFSNGLFDITVPVGTAATGAVVELGGTVGGPSSTGATGDNHMIYAVARASADPISMIFRGNLGFDPAASAGIVNGEIILSANYNVFGRTVDGSNIGEGINATFRNNSELSATRADILLEDFTASSSLLAIGTHLTQATARNAASSVTGNLLMVGRERSELTAGFGQNFTITGDVLVDARDYGVVGSGLQSLDVINARGGSASIDAFGGSTMMITGNALVTADALGGADDLNRVAGTARGGQALLASNGGFVTISGNAAISAQGLGTTISGVRTGAEARGGLAQVFVRQGGSVTVDQSLLILADGTAAEGDVASPSTVSNAYGGRALVSIFDGGGTLTVGGDAGLSASADAFGANASTGGALADAGEASVAINGAGTINIQGVLFIEANARAAINGAGQGGRALGGAARAITENGNGLINVTGNFRASAVADGGDGTSGGDAFGGIAGAIATTGRIFIGGAAQVETGAQGGDAIVGNGGNGGLGRGGNAFLQANGTSSTLARLTIGGGATVSANGVGGTGGESDGQSIPAGNGGDGYGGSTSTPNQADPNFRSGAYLLAGGDYGTLSVTGNSQVIAQGVGGEGGLGGSIIDGGRGGNGFGGLAQAGLALLGGPGTVGGGSATFANVLMRADGFGGLGGFSGFDSPTGDGGNGTGGFAALTVRAGDITANQVELIAGGFGGDGRQGGIGTGGAAAALGGFGGVLNLGQFTALASGFGGSSGFSLGGLGQGGVARIEMQGIAVTVTGDMVIDASGTGGFAEAGTGGDGIGGTAFVGVTNTVQGSGTFRGNSSILANGFGGTPGNGGIGGIGRGGLAYAQAQAGSVVRFGSLQVTASGRGGENEDTQILYSGGAGIGGTAELRSLGSGSNLIIEQDFGSNFSNALNDGAIVAALGIGGQTTGGSGIGGTGSGGSILLRAAMGGTMALPANPTFGSGQNKFLSGAYGGASSAEGGSGGSAIGGNMLIQVESGTITMGQSQFLVETKGGDGNNSPRNISGGGTSGGFARVDVAGGSLTMESASIVVEARGGSGVGTSDGGVAAVGGAIIDVTGGGVLTAQLESRVDAFGGNALGTGNGGDAFIGTHRIAVIGGTLNVVNWLGLSNRANGGDGVVGGDALNFGAGVGTFFTADDATVAFTSSNGGVPQLLNIFSSLEGGTGTVQSGAALGGITRVAITDSTLTGGPRLMVRSDAVGGNVTGPDGIGGLARSDDVSVDILRSVASLAGDNLITSLAAGGDGAGAGADGGAAVSGAAAMSVTGSNLSVGAGFSGSPGKLMIRSFAGAGNGDTIGAATAGQASLLASSSAISADEIEIDSSGVTDFFAPALGLIGGAAQSGVALLALEGDATINADLIRLFSSSQTSGNGTARAGEAVLTIAAGSTAAIQAGDILLQARGFGGTGPANNIAGRFDLRLEGGTVNAGNFVAQALGDTPSLLGPSQLAATGGNLLVSGNLTAESVGDIVVRTGQGGIIGNAAINGNSTAIQFDAGGTIEIVGDSNPTGGLSGQTISMAAGRSILLDGNVVTRDGAIALTANRGGGQALAQPPVSVITMGQGSRINAGTGTVTIRLLDGAGDPQRVNGAITLASIAGGRIDVDNLGMSAGSNIGVRADGGLTASASGRAIDLASLNGEVINLAGDAGLVLTGGGHYGIFAATPTGSQIGNPASYARRYNVGNGAAFDTLNPGGNFAAFRIVPVLTVSTNAATRFYGSADPVFTASFAGFLPGDGIANLSGTPQFTAAATGTSNVGVFAINTALGSLLSEQGYQFTFNPGLLTITARPITVTANNLTRVYGNANPALAFAVGGQGLVNGDQLSGALATTAGAATGVGNVPITQGTLAASANYALTFVGGQLTITPRPLSLTADNLSKLLGQPDPLLTFTLTGDGLVNGDQLSGGLVRDPGEAIDSFAIRQGTLSAGSNYAITFAGGLLTINAPPIPLEFTNQTVIDPPFLANEALPMSSDEEEEGFGADFSVRPEAALITEDPLLDDPVASGGDASVYGRTATLPPPAGEGK